MQPAPQLPKLKLMRISNGFILVVGTILVTMASPLMAREVAPKIDKGKILTLQKASQKPKVPAKPAILPVLTLKNFGGLSYFVSDGTGKNWYVLDIRYNHSPLSGKLEAGYTYQEWVKGQQTHGEFGPLPESNLNTLIERLNALPKRKLAAASELQRLKAGKGSGLLLRQFKGDASMQHQMLETHVDGRETPASKLLKSRLARFIKWVKAQPPEPVYGYSPN